MIKTKRRGTASEWIVDVDAVVGTNDDALRRLHVSGEAAEI